MSEDLWVAVVLPPELFVLLEDCAEATEVAVKVSTVAMVATKAV